MMSAPITLTTDFGLKDSYVAQMKGLILQINPEARLVDVTHQIPAQDIVRAAFVLNETIDAFPEGTIHLVVVDPGVGSDRRLLAVEMASQRFVLPDNGLLGVIGRRYDPEGAVELTEQKYWRGPLDRSTQTGYKSGRSSTFHGRDILAPVAAHWSLGHELSKFGRPLSRRLQSLPLTEPQRKTDSIVGEIVWIDSFGNLITNIDESILPDVEAGKLGVAIGRHHIVGINRFYAERPAGELLAVIGSSGQLEIAVNQGNAARELGVSMPAHAMRVCSETFFECSAPMDSCGAQNEQPVAAQVQVTVTNRIV